MFAWWGGQVVRWRRWVLGAGVVFALIGVLWGAGVFGTLSNGGFDDNGSENQRAQNLLDQRVGNTNPDVVVLFRNSSVTVDDAAYRQTVDAALAKFPAGYAVATNTYWTTHSAAFVSADRHETFAAVSLKDRNEDIAMSKYNAMRDVVKGTGYTVQVGGQNGLFADINSRVKQSIARAETLSMPVLLVLLTLVFGSLAAASLPLAVGALAILGSFIALRVISFGTDVSVFAVNIVTILGLGLAIDYGLFMVSRFREELRRGATTRDAVVRTMATAGRTVAVSAVTVAVSLAGLLLFPQTFLKSMGYGGISAVLVAALAALTVLPALLAVLGPRVDALSARGLFRRVFGRGSRSGFGRGSRLEPGRVFGRGSQPGVEPESRPGFERGPRPGFERGSRPGFEPESRSGFEPESRRGSRGVLGQSRPSTAATYTDAPRADAHGFWFRWAHAVMRRPVLFAVPVVAVLLALGAPFLHVKWGGIDARMEPTSAESRQVSDTLVRDFPDNGSMAIQAAVSLDVPVASPIGQTALQEYSQAAGSVHGATGARVVAARGDTARVDITYRGEALDAQAKSVLKSVRALPHPAHVQSVLVGGSTAQVVDRLHSLGGRLPWMALVVSLTTFVLLFLAFGSLVLPLKALVMNILSLGASFGAVTWIFQDGHLSSWLGFTPTGTVEATQPVLVLAIIFGLSMDYEVFLLSRVREQYDATGDNRQAVAVGIQRTGRIITSAALLLMVVIGLFSTSSITFMKLIGVAMLVALIIDATIVRLILVPATMRLLGRANWWAPGPLRQLYARYGIRESEEAPAQAEPVTV